MKFFSNFTLNRNRIYNNIKTAAMKAVLISLLSLLLVIGPTQAFQPGKLQSAET
jgi:hypothetical protein